MALEAWGNAKAQSQADEAKAQSIADWAKGQWQDNEQRWATRRSRPVITPELRCATILHASVPSAEAMAWSALMRALDYAPLGTCRYDRFQVASLFPGLLGRSELELLISGAGDRHGEFESVSFSSLGIENVQVARPTQRYLKRELSQGEMPAQMPSDKPRRFFRTWVRAVKRQDLESALRGDVDTAEKARWKREDLDRAD